MTKKELDEYTKQLEEYGIKVIVNGEQYEAYKGTLQDEIEKQSKYIEMLQNNIEKLAEEKINLQDRINKATEYIEKLVIDNENIFYIENSIICAPEEMINKLYKILKGK